VHIALMRRDPGGKGGCTRERYHFELLVIGGSGIGRGYQSNGGPRRPPRQSAGWPGPGYHTLQCVVTAGFPRPRRYRAPARLIRTTTWGDSDHELGSGC